MEKEEKIKIKEIMEHLLLFEDFINEEKSYKGSHGSKRNGLISQKLIKMDHTHLVVGQIRVRVVIRNVEK
jgi:hypothetical protein